MRDTVIGSSGMLSEMHDKVTKRSTAGIRVDVPGFLRSEKKILEEYGRRIRMKHRGTKHHLKFDEGKTTIYLNIRKAGERDWSRVYPGDARDWVRDLRKSEAEKVNKKFNQNESEMLAVSGNISNSASLRPTSLNESVDGSRRWGENGGGDGFLQKKKMAGWTGKAGSATANMS